MSRSFKYCLALLLSGVMLMGSVTTAFAAEEKGPGIELQKKLEEESRNAEQQAGGETQTPVEGEVPVPADGEVPNEQASSELAAESAAAAAEAAAQANSPLTVPGRQPHLQTTVLWTDGNWSTPFVNDQWVYQDGKTFMSISIDRKSVV